MDSGQRALLKYWREQGIVDKLPPRLVGPDEKTLSPRTWTAFFAAMDAFNFMAFFFDLEDVFPLT